MFICPVNISEASTAMVQIPSASFYGFFFFFGSRASDASHIPDLKHTYVQKTGHTLVVSLCAVCQSNTANFFYFASHHGRTLLDEQPLIFQRILFTCGF